MVALSGAHTIGQARCTSFRGHIYNDTNIDASFARTRRSNCPRTTGSGDTIWRRWTCAPHPLRQLLLQQSHQLRGPPAHGSTAVQRQWLHQLRGQGLQRQHHTFFSDFVSGMTNMGDIRPLTGSDGEIRRNCRKIN
ncbi:peroxidase [Musa troglodytarum]|uniref:Peroxidase n=1 Tax=Musa troglodytarum TaxID=320322 RepID=A0A9E7K4F6_9LILI|nr:peroxidase [Musa troglodytarum]URE02916.1 peroxidase [Musa troglodytarum]